MAEQKCAESYIRPFPRSGLCVPTRRALIVGGRGTWEKDGSSQRGPTRACPQTDTELLMSEARVSREEADAALNEWGGDIAEAFIHLIDARE